MDNYFLYPLCIIIGGAGACFIDKFALKLGLLDSPNGRSSHFKPTPKGGGIGILAAFILSSLILKIPASFWVSTTFLALFSLIGDKTEIPPKLRLPIQFIAALIVLFPPLFSNLSVSISSLSSLILYVFFSIFIVGTANYYNFMDGINGIASFTGVIGFGFLGFYALSAGSSASIGTLAICMSLACLGFLPFNMPNAKVFMGDVGSILLGFVFAGIVVQLSRNFLDFVCMVAFLFPFYADAFTTMFVRLKGRKSLFRPHRRHIYQLLANEMGIAHWKVSVGYGILQLIVGASVLMMRPLGVLSLLGLLAIFFYGFLLISFRVRASLTS